MDLCSFGHKADHELRPKVFTQLVKGGDDVDDSRSSGVAEVGIAGIEEERRRFVVKIHSVEVVLAHDLLDGREEVFDTLLGVDGEELAAAAEGDHDLLA